MSTKTELLDHAETLVRSRGFDGFSYADLAEAVGIRKASIHYHFPTKAELSLELITRYRVELMKSLQSVSEQEETAAGRLSAFVAAYRAALDDGQSLCLCVALSVTQVALPDDSKVEIVRFHEDVSAWLKETYTLALADNTVRDVSDPEDEAHATLAVVEGAQVMARSARRVDIFDKATRILHNRIETPTKNVM